jgi:hypothetical protein
MHITKIGVSFFFLSLAFANGAALASSCVNPTYQQIRFKAGAYCWEYAGKATHFSGDFAQGQTVVVSMQGFAYYGTVNGKTDSRWENRSPAVIGPNGFVKVTDAVTNTLRIKLPYAGVYTFNFYPCAMWHGYGKVRICAY